MIRTLRGRVCRHIHAIPTRDCPQHAAITWCPTCKAEWCELVDTRCDRPLAPHNLVG